MRGPTGSRRRGDFVPSPRSGFSLIELMIAALLAVIISAMMFAVLNNQETAARKTDGNAQMQDALRFALQVMSRQIRMTGYGVGYQVIGSERLNGAPTLVVVDNMGLYDFDPTNGTDRSTGTDQIMAIYRNPALEFDLAYKLYQKDQAPCSTTVLVSGAGPENKHQLAKDTTIVCMDDGTPYQWGAYAWTLLADAETGSDAAVGTIPVGGIVRLKSNASEPFSSMCPGVLPVFMTCGSLEGSAVGFYIQGETLWMDDNGDSLQQVSTDAYQLVQANPADTDDIPLARNIEDMQIALCIPGYNDPTAPDDVLANQLADCIANPNSPNWYQPGVYRRELLPLVRAIRITLVAKGPRDLSGQSVVSTRPTIENHAPGQSATSGQYPRMVESTIVQLPNIRFRRGLQAADLTGSSS